jgi:hypothetical protein
MVANHKDCCSYGRCQHLLQVLRHGLCTAKVLLGYVCIFRICELLVTPAELYDSGLCVLLLHTAQ